MKTIINAPSTRQSFLSREINFNLFLGGEKMRVSANWPQDLRQQGFCVSKGQCSEVVFNYEIIKNASANRDVKLYVQDNLTKSGKLLFCASEKSFFGFFGFVLGPDIMFGGTVCRKV
jgi:hypothetical protein